MIPAVTINSFPLPGSFYFDILLKDSFTFDFLDIIFEPIDK